MLAALPAVLITAAFVACPQPTAVDGDNIRCDGMNLRVIGVNAREADNSCRRGAPCPQMSGQQARQAMQQLIARGVRYRVHYRDAFGRPVVSAQLPDGRDLSCALIARGAAVRWDRYWPAGKSCT